MGEGRHFLFPMQEMGAETKNGGLILESWGNTRGQRQWIWVAETRYPTKSHPITGTRGAPQNFLLIIRHHPRMPATSEHLKEESRTGSSSESPCSCNLASKGRWEGDLR
jgi:hypothetical protein